MAGVEKTRVALVASMIAAGGVETFMFRLAQFFTGRGMEVEFVATEQPGEWFGRAAEFGRAFCVPGRGSAWPLWQCARVGRLLASRRYDLVILNGSRLGQAALGMLPDRVAVITVLHIQRDWVYRQVCSNPAAWNALVGVSPAVCDGARRLVPDRPVRWIPNGIEPPGPDAVAGRRPWQPGLRAAFVGRVAHEQKGVFLLPDIVRGCRDRGIDLTLTVAGDGPDLPELRRRVREAGIEGQVEFRGLVSPEAVRALLLDSHLLLMPSFYEGLPIVSLEAQACGCVPVASLLPGVTDAAISAETGLLVPVGAPEGFVEAVAKLSRPDGPWAALSAAGPARVAAKFTVETMGSAYLGLFEEIRAGRHPLPRPRGRGRWIDLTAFSRRELAPGLGWLLAAREARS